MADPTPYIPGYSYSGWQATNPSKPLPGPQVDNDFANISRSVRQIIDALKNVRRSDGALANQSVGPDQLSAALTIGFTLRGAWTEGVTYSAGDGVVYNSAFYSARLQHVADGSNPPTNSTYWMYLFSVDDLVVAGALAAPVDTFTGDGVQTQFPLSFIPVSERNLWVQVGGQLQEVGEYAINGAVLTLVTPAPSGYTVQVRGLTTTATLVEPMDGSVTEQKLSSAVLAMLMDAVDTTELNTAVAAALAGAAIGINASAPALADLDDMTAASKLSYRVTAATPGTWPAPGAGDAIVEYPKFDATSGKQKLTYVTGSARGREFWRTYDASTLRGWTEAVTGDNVRLPLSTPMFFECSIPLNVREKGVIGNDNPLALIDESANLLAAMIQARDEKRELLWNDTNYQIGTQLALSGSIDMGGRAGRPFRLYATQALSNAGSTLISLTGGSVVSGLTLGGNIRPGQNKITLGSTTGVSVGDLIFVNSATLWYYDPRPGGPAWKKGEMHRVVRVINSTQVAIDGVTQYAYNTGTETITVFRLTPSRIRVNDVEENHLEPAVAATGTGGIFLANAFNPILENVKVNRASGTGIQLRRCWRPICRNISFDGSGFTDPDPDAGTNIGYGLSFQACVDGHVNGLDARSLRRAFDANTFNGSANSITRDTTVENFRCHGGGWETQYATEYQPTGAVYNAGVGGHGGYDRLTFRNGYITGVEDGITARGRGTLVDNVTFYGQLKNCVDFTFGSDLDVRNCKYDDALRPAYSTNVTYQADYFVMLGTDTGGGAPVNDNPIVVENNTINGTRKGLVGINKASAGTITNLFVRRNIVSLNLSGGDSWSVIAADGAGAVRLVGDCEVRDNPVYGSTSWNVAGANVTIGYTTAGTNKMTQTGEREYRARIVDDAAVVVAKPAGVNGDPIACQFTAGTTTSGDIVLFAASATARKSTGIASAVSGTDFGTAVDILATAPFTGTSGTDGRFSVGMTSTGDVWFENRTGSDLTLVVTFG